MVEPIEKGRHVGVYDMPVAVFSVTDRGGDGVVGLTPLPEPEAPFRHVTVEERIEDLE